MSLEEVIDTYKPFGSSPDFKLTRGPKVNYGELFGYKARFNESEHLFLKTKNSKFILHFNYESTNEGSKKLMDQIIPTIVLKQ